MERRLKFGGMVSHINLKGGTSSFLFILRSLLIEMDSVVYYFINVLQVLKPFMIQLKL